MFKAFPMYSPCQTLMNNCFSYPLLQSIILNFQNFDSFGMLFHFQNDLNPFLLIILCVCICDSMCVHVYVCVCSFVMCEHMYIHVHECRTCMPRKVCRVTSEDGFSHGSLPDTLRQESLVLWGLPLQATQEHVELILLSSHLTVGLCNSRSCVLHMDLRDLISGSYNKDFSTESPPNVVL